MSSAAAVSLKTNRCFLITRNRGKKKKKKTADEKPWIILVQGPELHYCQKHTNTHTRNTQTHTKHGHKPLLGSLEIFIVRVLHSVQHAMTNLCKTAWRPNIPSIHGPSSSITQIHTHARTHAHVSAVSSLSSIFKSYAAWASWFLTDYFPPTHLSPRASVWLS